MFYVMDYQKRTTSNSEVVNTTLRILSWFPGGWLEVQQFDAGVGKTLMAVLAMDHLHVG